MDFAKAHMNEATEFRHSVIYSNECKFYVSESDGRVKVWRKENAEMKCKNLRATIKHDGESVLVWRCMSAAGIEDLVLITLCIV